MMVVEVQVLPNDEFGRWTEGQRGAAQGGRWVLVELIRAALSRRWTVDLSLAGASLCESHAAASCTGQSALATPAQLQLLPQPLH
jgi:hypothetical protein